MGHHHGCWLDYNRHVINPDHLECLCSRLAIGRPSQGVARVFGGLHHTMWRLDTSLGTYAVKQLSADTDLDDADIVDHYNVTEAIAEAFYRRGIPAIYARKANAQYLQIIGNVGYLTHPWTSAVALDLKRISERHALQVAGLLARMHRADIFIPNLQEPQLEVHPEEKIFDLVHRASEAGLAIARPLREQLPAFLNIVDCHQRAIQILQQHTVISHGDLDQKNVLWDVQGRPFLIDWECARKLNPTFEIMLEALDWSGIASRFNPELFGKILSAYEAAGGVVEPAAIEASFHGILGDWLTWLMYNVGRSVFLEDAEQRLIGAEQVHYALATILRLQQKMSELLPLFSGRTAERSFHV